MTNEELVRGLDVRVEHLRHFNATLLRRKGVRLPKRHRDDLHVDVAALNAIIDEAGKGKVTP